MYLPTLCSHAQQQLSSSSGVARRTFLAYKLLRSQAQIVYACMDSITKCIFLGEGELCTGFHSDRTPGSCVSHAVYNLGRHEFSGHDLVHGCVGTAGEHREQKDETNLHQHL